MVTMIMLILEAAIQPTSKKHPNFKRLLNVGETTVRHTDSEGKVFFDNLDQGTYQITEIKTEPGNALLKEPIIFTLPFTMTMEEATQYQNVDFDSAKEDVGYTNKWYFYNCKYDITNNAVFKMPMTGDDGKWKYGFIGFSMVAALGCGYVTLNTKNHKKRNHRKMKKQK
ncbi:prealbumin-like fold domain-containing protein [Blautia wexlerae]|uniref:prealbumin-like fold domain-containing protein n=1 Tax=Blautia wexlerae TaxID=418240 RepID=UPI0032C1A197